MEGGDVLVDIFFIEDHPMILAHKFFSMILEKKFEM
jgi:hypothetical protein